MAKNYRKLQVFNKTTDFKAAVQVVEVPLREPEPDEVRVKQIYAGINATDINITAARYFTDGKVPFDIGFESLGVIDSVGSGLSSSGEATKKGLKIGQPVVVFGGSGGKAQGFSEFSYPKLDSVIPVPALKPEYLVALVNGLTASIALDKAGRVKAGDKVLITAAAGGTGQIAVQWAKKRGAYVIGTTSSAEKAKYLKQIGVDFVINYREENLDQVLTDKFPDGIDVIWETVGNETFRILFNHLASKGRLVIIGSIQNYKGDGVRDVPIEGLNGKLLFGSKSLNGFVLFDYYSDIPEYLPQLISGITDGSIKAQVDLGEQSPDGKFFGIDQVYRAEDWLHASKNIGKVVAQLQNP